MRIKRKSARKFLAILANISLLFNSFLPLLLTAPAVFAQDATPTPQPENSELAESTPTPELQPESPTPEPESPTPEPTEEPTLTPELETPTPEPSAEFTPTPEPQPQADPPLTETPTPTIDPVNSQIGTLTPTTEITPAIIDDLLLPPTPTQSPEIVCLTDEQIRDTTNQEWVIDDVAGTSETINKVELGVRYVYPQENNVTVTFKCLPADENLRTPLKIQKVKTADLNLPHTMGSVGEFAYDITTGMTNGTFEYDITLPKPANSTAEVSYIEKSLDDATNNEIKVDEVKLIEESKTEQYADTVKAVDIDHFTIFIASTHQGELSAGGFSSGNITTYSEGDDINFRFNVSSNGAGTGTIEARFTGQESACLFFIDSFSLGSIEGISGAIPSVTTLGSITQDDDEWVQIIQVNYTSAGESIINYTLTLSDEAGACSGSSQHSRLGNVTGDFKNTGVQNVPIPANDIIVLPDIIVTKELDENGDGNIDRYANAGEWSFTLNGNITLSTDETGKVIFENVSGGSHIITEAGPEGYAFLEGSGDCVFSSDGTATLDFTATTDTTNKYCEFINGLSMGTITIVKNSSGGDGTFNFTSDFGVSSVTTANGVGSQTVNNLVPGSYSVSEIVPDGWDLTSVNCISSKGDEETIGNLVLQAGETITCTFTNTQRGSISGYKWDDADGNIDTFTDRVAVPNWSIELWQGVDKLQTTTTNSDGYYEFSQLIPGVYQVKETASGYWFNVDEITIGVTLDAGEDEKNIDFINAQYATVTVYKNVDTDGDGDIDTYGVTNWTWDIADKLDNQTGTTVSVLKPGTYTISEDQKDDYHVTSLVCNNGVGTNPAQNYGAVTSQSISLTSGQDLICTFTNTRDTGGLIVQKVVDDGSDLTQWSFSLNGSPAIQADTNGYVNFGQIPTGFHSITESGPNGYSLLSISGDCNENPEVVGQADTTITTGATKTCVFTNTINKGSLTIIKDALPDDPQNFSFTTTGSGLTDFYLDDDADATLSNTKVFSNLFPGTYSVSEEDVAGWTLDNIKCTNTTGNWKFDNSNLEVEIKPGEHPVCTFTNGLDTGTLIAHKFEDNNLNKEQDNNEKSLSGWDMNLYIGNNCRSYNYIRDINTNYQGDAYLGNLVPGNYSVRETLKPGWENTTPLCQNITISHNDNKVINFGNYQLGKIEGRKFYDKNGNKTRDNGEDYLKNWKIFIDKNNDGFYNYGEKYTYTNSNGYYKFDDLTVGNFTVCEQLKSGWYNSTPICKSTYVSANDTDTINFGNMKYGSVRVCKVITDAAGQIVDGSALSGSTFSISGLDITTSQGSPAGVLGNTIFTTPLVFNTKLFNSNTNNSVCTTYSNLKIGNYYYGQELTPGSVWSTPKYNDGANGAPLSIDGNFYDYSGQLFDTNPNNDGERQTISDGHIVLSSDNKDRTLIILNEYKFGTVEVTKFNDLDGDGIKDGGEENLPGWQINLSGQASVNTDTDGIAIFDQLLPGNYFLTETMLEIGWTQTGIYCSSDRVDASATQTPTPYEMFSILSVPQVNAVSDDGSGHPVPVEPGDQITCYIGNQYVEPELTISKFNNRWPNTQSIGSEVEYTITLNVHENKIDDVSVVDLPPEGFKYKPGSYKVLVNDNPISIPEPVYSSPGTWEIGDLNKDDVVTLTYLATIDNSVDPGTYKDAAWAYGLHGESQILASSVDSGKTDPGVLTDTFVGTQIKIDPTIPGQSVDLVREEGQVLGASTELPATGANTVWMILFLILSALGLSTLYYGFKPKRKNMAKNLILIILLSLFSLIPAKAAFAEQSPNIYIGIENPISPTNQDNFNLSFTTLDILNRPLTVKCFKINPDFSEIQIGSDVAIKPGGNSGNCSLQNNRLTESGKTYYFYAIAYADGESYRSDNVAVDYNTSGPGTPAYYQKDKEGSCRYKISFEASNDGKTTRIEIYRSDLTDFIADSGSKIGEVGISPGQKGSFTDVNVPDCNKTYYYVIRAFDSAGNASGLAGDFFTVYTTTTTSDTTGSVVPAIPIIGEDNLLPEDEADQTDDVDQDTGEPQEGSVLGSEADQFTYSKLKTWVESHPFLSIAGTLLLVIIIRYALSQLFKKKR